MVLAQIHRREEENSEVILRQASKSNHEVVMAAVSRMLWGCSLTPKSSRATMRLSLCLPRSCCPCTLRPKILRTVKRWSLQQAARLPCALHFAPKELKNDHDFVLAAFSKDPVGAASFASEELRSNHEFVLTLFSEDPAGATCFASKELRSNHEFVMALFSKQVAGATCFASEELRSNHEFVMAALSENPVGATYFASEELRSNHEFVMAALSKDPTAAACFASMELRNSYDFIMAVVSQNPLAPPSASVALRGNNETVVSYELREDFMYYWRYPLVTLNVVLLSGRCSSTLFSVFSALHAVLLECAGRLGLDPHQVTATGVLLSGS